MTAFHLSVTKGFYGRGDKHLKTALEQSAYNNRERYQHERDGHLTKDHRPDREDVLFEGMFVDPKFKSPAWVNDREKFWNALDKNAVRGDERQAQGMIASFPDGLTQKQREWMLTDFIREQFTRRGYVVDAVIHRPSGKGDERNYHTHLLWALREISPEGFGKKLPHIEGEQMLEMRERWANLGARQLDRAERTKTETERHRVSHKTLKDQRIDAQLRKDFAWADGLDRLPTRHEGQYGTAARRRGEHTDTTLHNDWVRKVNGLNRELRDVKRHIGQFGRDVEHASDRVFNKTIGGLGKALDLLGQPLKILGDVLDIFGGPTLTPAQQRAADRAIKEREADADHSAKVRDIDRDM